MNEEDDSIAPSLLRTLSFQFCFYIMDLLKDLLDFKTTVNYGFFATTKFQMFS